MAIPPIESIPLSKAATSPNLLFKILSIKPIKHKISIINIKKFLFNVLEETLNPIRERRAVLQADIAAVMKVLEDGCVKANEKANATLKRAKDAMKINYFDDKDNITEYFK